MEISIASKQSSIEGSLTLKQKEIIKIWGSCHPSALQTTFSSRLIINEIGLQFHPQSHGDHHVFIKCNVTRIKRAQ
jgi:hypothetical protein